MELLEREDYLSQLINFFAQAENGIGHTVFLMGEAGIGKTSIVHSLENEIKSRAHFYFGACDSLFTPRPLGPLYDIAGKLGESFIEMLRNDKSRNHIFSTFLEELCKSSPLVLVFEDLHWADEATVDFIKYMARRIKRSKCLFLLTCRDNEVRASHPVRNLFGELPTGVFSKLNVEPLSEGAVKKIAASFGYTRGSEVYHLTGGNPFYVIEILSNDLQRIPDHLKDSILRIFRSKDVDTQELLSFLSIIPTKIEFRVAERIKKDFGGDIDDCVWSGIIVKGNEYFSFKHELFRLTIEESLQPSKRKNFHKKMFQILLETRGVTKRFSQLVHHAQQVGEKELIAQIVPMAAKEASLAGAHIEACKLYRIAIDNTPTLNSRLAELYDNHAHECYLINQAGTAIESLQKALDFWRAQKNRLKIGNALRFMSRLKWLQGRRDEVMALASESIIELEQGPPTHELALSYSHLSQLYVIYNDLQKGLKWGQKALDLAVKIEDQSVLAHALNDIGTVQLTDPSTQVEGEKNLAKGLSLALKNNWHEQVGRAYSNCATIFALTKNHSKALVAFDDGLKYCEANDLTFLTSCMLSEKVKLLLDKGNWEEAKSIALLLKANTFLPPLVRIGAITVLSRIYIRKGEFEEAQKLIAEGKKISRHSHEAHQFVPILISELELFWIDNKPIDEGDMIYVEEELFPEKHDSWYYSELAYWMNKCGILTPERKQVRLTKPYHIDVYGDSAAAAQTWKELGCPYERALALFNGDQKSQREALAILSELGASATYRMLRAKLKTIGIKKIPKGHRKSTRNNPMELTNRQIDILTLLSDGLQNVEIADKLFISTKTVTHHVSAILARFEVNSRTKAVAVAKKMGILS